MARREPLRLFEGVGLEIEYMIVGRDDLAVRPISDALIRAQAGRVESEIEVGAIAWSNEVVLHVIELKTNGPAPGLGGLARAFQGSVDRALALLEPLGARLMPTAMHPFMDPLRETRLWPHEYGPVYAAFDRIFDCRGHGWANLQSVHLNLPFRGDEEFGRLHAALRLVLPILPALAASSPVADGRPTGLLDTRLEHYRGNARRVPSVTGAVIPEPIFSRAAYEEEILGGIYADLEPLDPEGTLRHEWVNARGCIARFDRSAIEVRLLDVGESPRVDVAVADAVSAVARALVEERLSPGRAQRRFAAEPLQAILLDGIRDGGAAALRDEAYLRALGYEGAVPCAARALWTHLVRRCDDLLAGGDTTRAVLEVLLAEGCLAERILRGLGPDPDRRRIEAVYRRLCECLAAGEVYHAAP